MSTRYGSLCIVCYPHLPSLSPSVRYVSVVSDSYTVTFIELPVTSDAVLVRLHEIQQSVDQERFPADPIVPYEQRLRGWRTGGHCWAVFPHGYNLPVAHAWIDIPEANGKQHLVEFDFLVLPGYRRRGIGRALLDTAAHLAQTRQRSILLTQTNGHIPAGERFMQRINAQTSLASCTLQLSLAQFDPGLQNMWKTHVQRQGQRFALEIWTDHYSQHDLADVAYLHQVHDEAPRRRSVGRKVMTPVLLDQREQARAAQGEVRWAIGVRDLSNGTLVGITEATWNGDHPESVEQGITVVLPAYRRRGLAHWMKAALLDRLVQEQPASRFVRTGNATSNSAMLKVNYDIGFRVISEDMWWEIDLHNAQQYLYNRHVGGGDLEPCAG